MREARLEMMRLVCHDRHGIPIFVSFYKAAQLLNVIILKGLVYLHENRSIESFFAIGKIIAVKGMSTVLLADSTG